MSLNVEVNNIDKCSKKNVMMLHLNFTWLLKWYPHFTEDYVTLIYKCIPVKSCFHLSTSE